MPPLFLCLYPLSEVGLWLTDTEERSFSVNAGCGLIFQVLVTLKFIYTVFFSVQVVSCQRYERNSFLLLHSISL